MKFALGKIYIPLAMIPALLVIIVILKFGVNVPYWDDWVFVPFLEKFHEGQLTVKDFFAQHNEHRLIFPRLAKLGLISISRWNTFYELFASWAFILLTWLTLWDLLRITFGVELKKLIKPFVVVNSIMLFSLAQGENFIWGWQLHWFMSNFFGIFSIWALARWKGLWRGILVASLAAFVTTYSIATGQFLWGLGLLVLILERKTWKPRQILFWAIAGALSIGLYFYPIKYQSRNIFAFVDTPFTFAQFIFVSLGSHFGAMDLDLSFLCGVCGLLMFGISLAFLWRRGSTWGFKILPWTALAIYGLLSVISTAIGRAQGTAWQHPLVSRYSIFAVLFWIGALVNVVVAAQILLQIAKRNASRVQLVLALLAPFLLWGYVNTAIRRYEKMGYFSNRFHIGQSALYDYRFAKDQELKLLTFLKPDELRRRAAVLEAQRLGLFCEGTSAEIVARLKSAWTEEVKNLKLTEVNADLISIIRGEPDDVKQVGSLLEFTVRQQSGIHCSLPSNDLPRPTSRSRIFVIESQNASNVWILLHRKHGMQVLPVYSVPLKNNWKTFRLEVPRGVRRYDFGLHYTGERPITDKVKILIYDRPKSSKK